jgi:hypothetical protein
MKQVKAELSSDGIKQQKSQENQSSPTSNYVKIMQR